MLKHLYSICYNRGMQASHDNPRPVPPAVRRATRQVAESIAAWRKLRALTQAQLADRAGVGLATLARLERGEGGASVENLVKVLRALGILENVLTALDPYETDVGRLRSSEALPRRVRPKRLAGDEDG